MSVSQYKWQLDNSYLNSNRGQFPLGCSWGLLNGDRNAQGVILGLGRCGSGGSGDSSGGREVTRGWNRRYRACSGCRGYSRDRGWWRLGPLSQTACADATETVRGVAASWLAVGLTATVLLVKVYVLGWLCAALHRHWDEGLGRGAGWDWWRSLPIADCRQMKEI